MVSEDGKQNICISGLTEKNARDLNILMKIIEYGLNYLYFGCQNKMPTSLAFIG